MEIADAFETAEIYWDDNYGGHKRIDHNLGKHVNEYYVKNRNQELLRLILGKPVFCKSIVESISSTNLVYIHASGIEGLLYAREVKRINPSVHLIFDYHDSLNYELYYQLKKNGLSRLFKPIWSIYYKYYLKRLTTSVDALVGISVTQINDFKRLSGNKVEAIAVPNYRAFSPCFEVPRTIAAGSDSALIWLGSVMRGRDLNLVANRVRGHKAKLNLHVFGNIINNSIVTELQSLLGDSVRFYGAFDNEDEILQKLPNKAIGIFLGWDDPQNTDINSHASPNKYFTYVNMELPIIINSTLIELASDISRHHAGIAVNTQADFNKAVDEVSNNYSNYVGGVRKLKQYYSEIDPKLSIAKFLQVNKKSAGCEV